MYKCFCDVDNDNYINLITIKCAFYALETKLVKLKQKKRFEKHFIRNTQSKPRLELNKEFSTMSDLSKAWKCSSLPGLGLASIVLMHLQIKMFSYSICLPITIFGQVPYITHSYNCLLVLLAWIVKSGIFENRTFEFMLNLSQEGHYPLT